MQINYGIMQIENNARGENIINFPLSLSLSLSLLFLFAAFNSLSLSLAVVLINQSYAPLAAALNQLTVCLPD